MVDLEKGPGLSGTAPSLVERIKAIILKPNEEWPRIEAERTTQGEILRNWVLPLAAIGPLATFIGGQVFGYGALFVSYKPGFLSGLSTAVISYALAIVAVFVLAFIANFLAPKFEGVSNTLNAFKLVAYGATAAWLAGIFGLIPALGLFSILGLYSVYLFYTGCGPLMQIPEDKKIVYTVVTFVCAFVLNLLVASVATGVMALTGLGAAGTIAAASHDDDVTVNIPGVGKFDTAKIEEAAKRAEKIQKGEISAVPADTLKAMLPDSIGDFQRTGYSSNSVGSLGSGVTGTYKGGDYQFDLSVRDILAGGGFAAIAGMMNISSEKEDENGYERIGKVDGQWRSEKWNNKSNRGEYGVFVADRFQIEADGNVPSIDVLKAAVAKVDAGELEDLAE